MCGKIVNKNFEIVGFDVFLVQISFKASIVFDKGQKNVSGFRIWGEIKNRRVNFFDDFGKIIFEKEGNVFIKSGFFYFGAKFCGVFGVVFKKSVIDVVEV